MLYYTWHSSTRVCGALIIALKTCHRCMFISWCDHYISSKWGYHTDKWHIGIPTVAYPTRRGHKPTKLGSLPTMQKGTQCTFPTGDYRWLHCGNWELSFNHGDRHLALARKITWLPRNAKVDGTSKHVSMTISASSIWLIKSMDADRLLLINWREHNTASLDDRKLPQC
jgi:hypothetical protein